jgi:hypothetical protein
MAEAACVVAWVAAAYFIARSEEVAVAGSCEVSDCELKEVDFDPALVVETDRGAVVVDAPMAVADTSDSWMVDAAGRSVDNDMATDVEPPDAVLVSDVVETVAASGSGWGTETVATEFCVSTDDVTVLELVFVSVSSLPFLRERVCLTSKSVDVAEPVAVFPVVEL